MGWWITLGILFLLAVLPLGVAVRYDAAGAAVGVVAGPVRITLFPRPSKPKAPPKEKTPKEKPPKEKKKQPPEPKPEAEAKEPAPKGGSWTDFLPLVQLGLEFLSTFRRKLRVNRLTLKLILAGGDPCDLAVNYGRAWAALGNLLPRLERVLVIQKRDLEVECDFTGTQTTVFARLDITITLGRLLSLLVVYGIRAAKQFFAIQKKRKGGAKK